MSSSLYSSFLLDVDGNFSPAKFFQSFCEIACSEQLQYPGISGHRFEYSDSTEGTCDAPEGHPVVPTGSTTSSVHTSSNLLGSFPAQSPLSRDSFSRSTFSPSPSSDPVGSASPVKEEQLEAISDDEDEDDNFNHSVKMELPPVSPPVSMPSDSNLPPSAPWAQSTPASMLSATSSPPASDEHVQHELPKRRVQHRLKLVLDLDNTLLHACARSKIGNCDIKLQHFLDCEGKPEMYKFVLPQILTQVYYVKLRPGLRRFLREVSEYCDLAIHTNATREYADVIVAILDPDRSLFRGRVAAREDETAKDHKKNMDRLFGIEDLDVQSLVILDDRKDVWDDTFQPNIIHCGMYDYIESRKTALAEKYSSGVATPAQQTLTNTSVASDQWMSPTAVSGILSDALTDDSPFLDNPLVGISPEVTATGSEDDDCEDDDLITSANLSDQSGDENVLGAQSVCKTNGGTGSTQGLSATDESLIDYDTQLDWLRKLIISICEEFNRLKSGPDGDEVSVARLLSSRRRQVLQGVVVQTVGMYKSETSHPEHGWHDNGPMHRRRLVGLGAHVVEASVPELTHILAMRATQTIDRVKKERGDEVKYVHALWLHACESTWFRVPEDWFQATPLLKKYDFNPPKKPWVDHWRIAALANPKPFKRVQVAESIAATGDSNTIKTDGEFSVREHLVTGSYSHGAKVWSASEQIILKFDPIQSNRLNLALQSKSSAPSANLSDSSTQRSRRTGFSHATTTQGSSRWGLEEPTNASEWGPRRKRQRQDTHDLSQPSDWDVGQSRQGNASWRQGGRRWKPSWDNSSWENGSWENESTKDSLQAPDDKTWSRNRWNSRRVVSDFDDWGAPKAEPSETYGGPHRRGNIFASPLGQTDGPPYSNTTMFFSTPVHHPSKSTHTNEQALVGP